ncbi:MAG: hypothetical protein Q7T07_19190 [Burkholderiaceae bacterium]|nr:hypothetical protein [Burkholderiaceae bacterium]
MRSQIFVLFDKELELHFYVEDAPAMPHEAARAWLDSQFTTLECEPLRASGKLLTADKILRVTEAAGPALFRDEKWVSEYVKAVHTALGKPLIRVDVPSMAITY